MSDNKVNIPLRKALHILGNRHHLAILVPGLIRQALERQVSNENMSQELRKQINKILNDLSNLETVGKEADQLLKDIKQVLYDKLDPDKTMVNVTDNDIVLGGEK